MKITLTGATGFIGRPLVKALMARGDQLTILTRHPRDGSNPRYIEWDTRSSPPPEALSADAIIHLAGESVAQRWTAAAKERIRASRIDSTRALVRGLSAAPNRPKVLISASAIGIYGPRGEELLTETSHPGSGFLEDLSVQWESEAWRAAAFGIRVVNPRIGIVLGREGGALGQMLLPFKAGLGGRLGTGDQWMSWIHLDDLVRLLLFASDRDDVEGPVNATAPEPVRNVEFTRELGAALGRPAIIPVPVLALKLLYGEMANVLIASQRVVPQVATRVGFDFRFVRLRPALDEILGHGARTAAAP